MSKAEQIADFDASSGADERMRERVDHHRAAEREAERICEENQSLMESCSACDVSENLARAYLEHAATIAGGHDIGCDCVLHRDSGTAHAPDAFLPGGCKS